MPRHAMLSNTNIARSLSAGARLALLVAACVVADVSTSASAGLSAGTSPAGWHRLAPPTGAGETDTPATTVLGVDPGPAVARGTPGTPSSADAGTADRLGALDAALDPDPAYATSLPPIDPSVTEVGTAVAGRPIDPPDGVVIPVRPASWIGGVTMLVAATAAVRFRRRVF